MKRTLAILVAAVLFLGMFAIAANAAIFPPLPGGLMETIYFDMDIINVKTGEDYDYTIPADVFVGETYKASLTRNAAGDAVPVEDPPTALRFFWYVLPTAYTNQFEAIGPILAPTFIGEEYTLKATDAGNYLVVIAVSAKHTGFNFTSLTQDNHSADVYLRGAILGNGKIKVEAFDDLRKEFGTPGYIAGSILQLLVEAKLVKNENYGMLFAPSDWENFRTLVENAEDTDLQAALDAAWAAYAVAYDATYVSHVPALGTVAYNQLIINLRKALDNLKKATEQVIDKHMVRTQGKLEDLLKSLKALQTLDLLNDESTYKLTLAIADTLDAISWTKAKIRSYNQFTKTWDTKLEDAATAQELLMNLWTTAIDFFGGSSPAYAGEFARDVLEVADAAARLAAEEAAAASEADKVAAEAAAVAAQEAADALRELVRQLEARQPKLVAIDNIYNFFYGLIGANFFTDALSWVTRNLLFGWLWSPIKYSVTY